MSQLLFLILTMCSVVSGENRCRGSSDSRFSGDTCTCKLREDGTSPNPANFCSDDSALYKPHSNEKLNFNWRITHNHTTGPCMVRVVDNTPELICNCIPGYTDYTHRDGVTFKCMAHTDTECSFDPIKMTASSPRSGCKKSCLDAAGYIQSFTGQFRSDKIQRCWVHPGNDNFDSCKLACLCEGNVRSGIGDGTRVLCEPNMNGILGFFMFVLVCWLFMWMAGCRAPYHP